MATGTGEDEPFPVLLERLSKAYERVQSQLDDCKAENSRLVQQQSETDRRLQQLLQASPGDGALVEQAETGDGDSVMCERPDACVVPMDAEALGPCSRQLRECPVHAAPPPGVTFQVGDRVEVRDAAAEAWKLGTVTSANPLKVKPDCWTVDSAATWEFIRVAQDQANSLPPTLGQNGHRKASYDEAANPLDGATLGHEFTRGNGREGRTAKCIKTFLRNEMGQANACMQLPFAMGLWVTFALAVFYHSRNEVLHATDKAFTWDIEENANFAFTGELPFENGRMGHKNIYDVNSFADFWSWFDLGIVPLYWAEGWDVRETRANVLGRCPTAREAMESFGFDAADMTQVSANATFGRFTMQEGCPTNLGVNDVNIPRHLTGSDPVTPTYLYFNSVVGGMRLRQERNVPHPCQNIDMDVLTSLHSGECVTTKNLGYWLKPELRRAFQTDASITDLDGGETVYLLSGLPQSEIRMQIQALENRAWAGPLTNKIEILYTTYNPHQDMLTATFIMFFINQAGHIHKVVQPTSIWMHPYHGWWCYFLDILWIVLIFKMVIEEAMDIAAHWKQLGIWKGTKVYASVSNMIDWFGVFYSVFLAVMWWFHLERLEVLKDYMRQGLVEQPGTWADPEMRSNWFAMVEETMAQKYTFRVITATYPFVIVSRFFKACASQPRLSLVTRTLQEAASDIVHFGIVFAAVFVIYAESAMILFGQELADFANTGRSLTSVFRILLGDFDWEEMIQIGRMEAGIWFGSFMVLVNLIMLNMLLAIIMDVYTEVRGTVGSNAKTLWRQSAEVVTRKRAVMRGELVPFAKILEILDPTALDEGDTEDGIPDNTVFSVKKLRAIVPDLGEAQAEEVLEQSHRLEQQDEGISMSDMASKVVDIGQMQEEMRQMLLTLLMANQSTPKLTRSSRGPQNGALNIQS